MRTNLINIFCYVFIISLFLYPEKIHSQTDDNGVPYFPLRVGNTFYYKKYIHNPGGTDSSFVVSRITSTKIYNGKRYYFCTNFLGTTGNYYLRYDRTSGILFKYDSLSSSCNYDLAFFKLSANLGDSINTYCLTLPNTKCIWISDTTVFGFNTRNKIFEYSRSTINGYYSKTDARFDRNLGGIYYYTESTSPHASFSQKYLMQGCKINGVVRGDTIDNITPPFADSARYFPLQVGNAFYYKYYYYFNNIIADSAFVVSRITGTINKNNKSYFVLTNFAGRANVIYYLRYDLTNGKLMMYDSTNSQCTYEKEFYNFGHIPQDSSIGSCAVNVNQWCQKIKDTVFFGLQKKLKQYNWMTQSGNYGASKITFFIKDFGISSYHDGTSGPGHVIQSNSYLKGAKINGIVYGDTTSVIPLSYADSSRYFPIAIGNRWVFDVWRYPNVQWTRETYAIKRDTIMNGKRYFYLEGFPPKPLYAANSWVSYDTLEGIFKLRPEEFGMNDNYVKLSSHLGDTLNYVCKRIADTTLFNYQSKRKYFYYNWTGYHANSTRTLDLIRNIGPVFYKYTFSDISDAYQEVECILRGCLINGVKYGDTNTVGVNSISDVVPDKYTLYQNYPNPFNPTTTIRYELPKSGFVKLVVYDVLGRKIQTLVNEKLQPGTFEATFDGSNLNSGIYFYQMVSGDFKQTRKLILLK